MTGRPPDGDRVRAAEYVLGTLDEDERRQAHARLAADPAFATLVRLWERRLSPLHELAVPVAPPPELWRAVRADMEAAAAAARPRAGSGRPAAPAEPAGSVAMPARPPSLDTAVAPGTRPVAGEARSPLRPAKEGAGGMVSRLLGLSFFAADRAAPAPHQRRARRPAPAAPPAAPAPQRPVVPVGLRVPGGRTLSGAIQDAVAAGLLPPAERPPDAAPRADRLPPPVKRVSPPAPPRPRPPPEPLAPPPAFMLLEPEPPPEAQEAGAKSGPAGDAAAPAPAGGIDASPAPEAPIPAAEETAGGAMSPTGEGVATVAEAVEARLPAPPPPAGALSDADPQAEPPRAAPVPVIPADAVSSATPDAGAEEGLRVTADVAPAGSVLAAVSSVPQAEPALVTPADADSSAASDAGLEEDAPVATAGNVLATDPSVARAEPQRVEPASIIPGDAASSAAFGAGAGAGTGEGAPVGVAPAGSVSAVAPSVPRTEPSPADAQAPTLREGPPVEALPVAPAPPEPVAIAAAADVAAPAGAGPMRAPPAPAVAAVEAAAEGELENPPARARSPERPAPAAVPPQPEPVAPSASAVEAVPASAPGEGAPVEGPLADPTGTEGEEHAPLPGWVAAVASGAVSALPEPSGPLPQMESPAATGAARGGLPWPGIALALLASTLGLATFAAYREWIWPRGGGWVAVLQREPLPSVAVRLDPDTGVVFARALAPAPPEGEVYRLWLVPSGGPARLMGAFSAGLAARAPDLAGLGRGALGSAELVITLEARERPVAAGGPQGEVVYRGRLVPE